MSGSHNKQWRPDGDEHAVRQAGYAAVDHMYLYSVLRTNSRLIGFITISAVVLMFIYLQVIPPTYSARSQVILDTREQQVAPSLAVVSNLDVTNAVIAGEVVTLRSNVLIGEVVDELDLVNSVQFDPRKQKREPLFERLKRVVRGGEPPHIAASRMTESMLRASVVDTVSMDLEISQVGISYAISILFKSSNPEMAARIANAIADRYIYAQLDNKLIANTRANAWLSAQLDELSSQVQSVDAAVVDFKAGMIDVAQGSEDSINQLLAELHTRLVESSSDRADAEVRFGQVEVLMSRGGLGSVATIVTSPLLESLQRRRADLTSDQALLASTLGRKHPEMVSIFAQVDNIDSSIESELRRKTEEMRSEVIVTRNREGALQKQIEDVSERADTLSKASVRLSQLERSADATRVVYESFLSRYKETSAQADFQTPEARIIGRAEVPTVKSAPRKTLMLLAALTLGFSSAVALVFVRNMVRAPISRELDLKSVTHLPNLGLLPYVQHFRGGYSWLKREISERSKTTYMEHVKSIRTILFDESNFVSRRVVMITSSIPNEGKTAFTVALTKAISNGNSSYVLLDGDLRQPNLRRVVNIKHNEGCLVDYLEGKGTLKGLVQRSEVFDIDVITSARPSAEAADLLSSDQFRKLVERLASRYSTVIVNAPPVLYLSDAILLGKLSDSTLFAVQCGRTPSKVVHNSIQRLEVAGVKIDGTVLTMVRKIDAAARETEMYTYGY